jgi:VWFA-related protein
VVQAWQDKVADFLYVYTESTDVDPALFKERRFGMSSTGPVFFLVVGGLLLAATALRPSSAATQSVPAAAQAAPTTLQSNTSLVLVDVVVTSRNKPVQGLKESQFQVLENGKVQPITSFEEHQPPATQDLPKPAPLPPDTYGDRLDYPASSPVNVLLLDALNTPVADQLQARRQMLDYLKTLPPGTPIAIFTLASRLRMVQGISADRSLLSAAIQSAAGGPRPSAVLDPATDQVIDSTVADAPNLGFSQQAVSTMQQFQADITALQTDARVRLTLEAMQQLARYCSGIPSRKNLIWFSGSFPLNLDADASLDSPFEAARNYAEELRETSHLLSAARVAVYPVDARGLLTLPMSDASYSPSATTTAPAAGASNGVRHGTLASGMPAYAKGNLQFMKQTAAEHASMLQVAMDTGGWAFVDSNGLHQAVERIIEHGSSYYTIGYATSNKQMDGKFREIQIRVAGGKYQSAYRRGYYADDPLKRMPFRSSETSLAATAAHDAPTASELLFRVQVVPSKNEPAGPLKTPVKRYALDFTIDTHSLSLNTLADGSSRAQVEFIVIAYDQDGRRLNSSDIGFAFHLRPGQYEAALHSGIPKQVEFDLPPGHVYLRVAVHDLPSNRIGSTEFPLTVKAP